MTQFIMPIKSIGGHTGGWVKSGTFTDHNSDSWLLQCDLECSEGTISRMSLKLVATQRPEEKSALQTYRQKMIKTVRSVIPSSIAVVVPLMVEYAAPVIDGGAIDVTFMVLDEHMNTLLSSHSLKHNIFTDINFECNVFVDYNNNNGLDRGSLGVGVIIDPEGKELMDSKDDIWIRWLMYSMQRMVTVPFENMKLIFQCQPVVLPPNVQYTGMRDFLRRMLMLDGEVCYSLSAGHLPTLVRRYSIQLMYWLLAKQFNRTKRRYRQEQYGRQRLLHVLLMYGSVAVVMSLLAGPYLCSMYVARIRAPFLSLYSIGVSANSFPRDKFYYQHFSLFAVSMIRNASYLYQPGKVLRRFFLSLGLISVVSILTYPLETILHQSMLTTTPLKNVTKNISRNRGIAGFFGGFGLSVVQTLLTYAMSRFCRNFEARFKKEKKVRNRLRSRKFGIRPKFLYQSYTLCAVFFGTIMLPYVFSFSISQNRIKKKWNFIK